MQRDPRSAVLTSPPFLILLLCSLLYFTALGVLAVALPLYVANVLHGTSFAVGLVVGAVTVTAIVLRPAAGRLTAVRGSRVVVLAGLLVVTASIFCYTVADSVAALVPLRMVTGIGQAAAYVGLARLAFDLAPPDRAAEAVSYFTVAPYAGFAAGPVLGTELLDVSGYPMTWIVAGAVGVLALVCALFLREPPAEPGTAAPGERGSPAARTPRRWLQRDTVGPAVVLLLSLAGYAAFATTVPLYAGSLGIDAGLILAESSIVVLTVRLLGGRLPDLLGPVTGSLVSIAVQAAGWAIVAAVPTAIGLHSGVVLMSLGVSLLYPALFTFALRRAPVAQRGDAVATITMSFDVAYGLGPVLLGAVAASTSSHRSAFVAATVLNVLAFAVVLSRARSWRRSAVAPQRESTTAG
ncbi:putative MFS transporter [Actinoplanes missouriensis 431]|uniref:Putative MFS transporter n=1 Tax=Actinoplanes missouriensis (strain ATCC 14538 / DSM 43046 / CBS 188.64 / JCM 3121 / NBRC 102363 / NCIMB 12654 / NRRL B-3342 / UNCC 431) TaxID=512565 RepID=I0H4J0_ACTM4|nr:MFS transporter [Actinoplanes missouriensis]BAL87927.1 putative MFS transporter [Actinoplanes missouriensis 431]